MWRANDVVLQVLEIAGTLESKKDLVLPSQGHSALMRAEVCLMEERHRVSRLGLPVGFAGTLAHEVRKNRVLAERRS